MSTIQQLKRALRSAQKTEDVAERRRRRIEQQIGNAIAKAKGIVKGRFYYFLPNGNGRKFLVEVCDIGTWNKYNKTDEIGILIRYYNRSGAYQSRWQYTNFGEFLPAPQPKKGN